MRLVGKSVEQDHKIMVGVELRFTDDLIPILKNQRPVLLCRNKPYSFPVI